MYKLYIINHNRSESGGETLPLGGRLSRFKSLWSDRQKKNRNETDIKRVFIYIYI